MKISELQHKLPRHVSPPSQHNCLWCWYIHHVHNMHNCGLFTIQSHLISILSLCVALNNQFYCVSQQNTNVVFTNYFIATGVMAVVQWSCRKHTSLQHWIDVDFVKLWTVWLTALTVMHLSMYPPHYSPSGIYGAIEGELTANPSPTMAYLILWYHRFYLYVISM